MPKTGRHIHAVGCSSPPQIDHMWSYTYPSIPLIQWIRANIPPSEEKDELETLVESMKRKYLLTF